MDKSISFRGSMIHYTKIGNGTPVVLVHGFAEDGTIWDELSIDLKNNYLLIIPDIPGSGRSEMLNGEHISMEDYATSIKSILDAEKLKSVIMIGHSMGGYITLAFADKYPQLLSSIGLFHSSAYADDKGKKEARKKGIWFIKENGTAAFLKTTIPGLFKEPENHPKEIKTLLAKGRSSAGEALIQYYEAMIARPDRTHILKQLPVSFLFIMGEHDKAVPFQHSLEQTQLPVHSYVYILRNSAHMGMLEERIKCIRILADFLKDIDPN